MTAIDAQRGGSVQSQLDALVAVLDAIRAERAQTRPEIARHTGLSRAIVAQRTADLIARGLVLEAELGVSTGGRAPRVLRFAARAGHILAADLGATSLSVGATDLSGELLHHVEEPADVAAGPETILERICELFGEVSGRHELPGRLWGIGVGVPGPVEFHSGRTVAPPIMPGWDMFPVRDVLSGRYGVPVWVDNDVNILALGELRAGSAEGHENMVFVKIGTGIGAGIVAGGRLQRGEQGCAGDIGHIRVTDDSSVVCRCGKIGCLEALAGGAALARQALAAAEAGQSAFLADLLRDRSGLEAADVAWAASNGDAVANELIQRAGQRIGGVLASVVNLLNPSLIVIGGGVANAGDTLLAAVRQTVYGRSLPLATRDLVVRQSTLGDTGGLLGAAAMVIDELFSRARLPLWLEAGHPGGVSDIAAFG